MLVPSVFACSLLCKFNIKMQYNKKMSCSILDQEAVTVQLSAVSLFFFLTVTVKCDKKC